MSEETYGGGAKEVDAIAGDFFLSFSFLLPLMQTGGDKQQVVFSLHLVISCLLLLSFFSFCI